jgi:LacI family transcriptional regulator
MPTLEEIARLSRVSRSTVSRVVNDDPHVSDATRARVMAEVRRLRYRPHAAARSLAAGCTRIIGLLVPGGIETAFSDPIFPILTHAMASTCHARDYSVMLWLTEPDDELRMIAQILGNGLQDGLIVSTIHLSDEIAAALMAAALPFVLIGQHSREIGAHYVDVENYQGAQEITNHLLRMGYQNVAHISGPLDTTCAQHRQYGFLAAMRAHGRPVDPRLILEGDFTEASGYKAMLDLLPAGPDAVFAANDLMALGALSALQEAGLRVPEDVAVVGFDDLPVAAAAHPPLTTVRQPTDRMAVAAIEMLIDVIEHPDTLQHRVVLPTELVIRESCGAGRKDGSQLLLSSASAC